MLQIQAFNEKAFAFNKSYSDKIQCLYWKNGRYFFLGAYLNTLQDKATLMYTYR